MEDKIEKLKEMVKVQCSSGNWNYSSYMRGMANGMIFALSIMEDKEPVYLDAPEIWLEDAVAMGNMVKTEEIKTTEEGN